MYSDTLELDISFNVPVHHLVLFSRETFDVPVCPMDAKGLILLPPFLSWYPTSIPSRTLIIGSIATMKSSGDSESLWKILLLMLTSANLVSELVRIVFQLGIVFWRNLMVFSSASLISRHSISYECVSMSKAFL